MDDPARIRELAEMGVHGICSNDPRLFAVADRVPEPEKPKQSRAEKRAAKKTAKEAAKEQKAEEAG